MKAYRYLALTIAVLIVVQAVTIAWAFFGLTNWINEGGVINQEFLESEESGNFTAELGFALHMFFVGFVLIPLLSLILLIVSFFAKIRHGVTMAAVIFGLVILQALVLPELSRQVGSGFGALHGLNAIVILGVAIMAGQRSAVKSEAGAAKSAAPATPAASA